MQTCTRCGAINPDSSVRCDCGGTLTAGDKPVLAEGRVAGFWVRLLSDLLDAFVLGAIGFVLARIFRGPLLRLGESAAILGAPITLLYMGVLQSHIGRGQTVAKRLLGLRVLRLDGSFLTLDRALVRWALMGVLSYGGAVAIAMSVALPFLKLEALSAALAGAQLALILGCGLLVPFHPLKRGLHDLLTGSIVIRGGRVPTDHVARFTNPRRDRALVAGAIAVAVVGTAVGLVALRHLPASLQAGTNVVASIKQLGVQNPAVVDSVVSGPSGRFHHIIATGYMPTDEDGSPRIDNPEDRILAIVRQGMPLDGVDSIVVNLRRASTWACTRVTRCDPRRARAAERRFEVARRRPVRSEDGAVENTMPSPSASRTTGVGRWDWEKASLRSAFLPGRVIPPPADTDKGHASAGVEGARGCWAAAAGAARSRTTRTVGCEPDMSSADAGWRPVPASSPQEAVEVVDVFARDHLCHFDDQAKLLVRVRACGPALRRPISGRWAEAIKRPLAESIPVLGGDRQVGGEVVRKRLGAEQGNRVVVRLEISERQFGPSFTGEVARHPLALETLMNHDSSRRRRVRFKRRRDAIDEAIHRTRPSSWRLPCPTPSPMKWRGTGTWSSWREGFRPSRPTGLGR
jgi:uncharacterized RDD family membrane protein YckC